MSKNIKKHLLKTVACTLSLYSLGVLSPKEANAAWIAKGTNWYYSDDAGSNLTGWQYIDGNWYYMWSDGSMAYNTWLQSANGKWYYLNSNGKMATNTTINGCTLGSDGAWIITPKGALDRTDVLGEHPLRTDLSQNSRQEGLANSISTSNLNLSSSDNYFLETLVSNLGQEKLYLSEAQNQCIGKVLQGKYMITDIKMFSQEFKNIDCIGVGNEVDVIQQKSTIGNYKSNASYTYDKYQILSKVVNSVGSGFACIRVIIEFQEV